MYDDFWSKRIDMTCPKCQQLFKVRLRKLQFGSELVCRLCRYEFEASRQSDLPEVQDALAHMQRIVAQRRADGAAGASYDALPQSAAGYQAIGPAKPVSEAEHVNRHRRLLPSRGERNVLV